MCELSTKFKFSTSVLSRTYLKVNSLVTSSWNTIQKWRIRWTYKGDTPSGGVNIVQSWTELFVIQFLLPKDAQHTTGKLWRSPTWPMSHVFRSGPSILGTWRAKQHLHSRCPDFEILLHACTSLKIKSQENCEVSAPYLLLWFFR